MNLPPVFGSGRPPVSSMVAENCWPIQQGAGVVALHNTAGRTEISKKNGDIITGGV